LHVASSGLIIAFVVAVWAAYFVPLALRRYDEASKNASVESSGALSRVISRPAAAAAKVLREDPVAEPVAAAPPVRTLDRPAARLAAKRRRRTLMTLLTSLALAGALAGVGVIASYWVSLPVALVAAWLVACRIQVRGELGLSRVKQPSAPKQPRAPRQFRAPKIRKAVSKIVEEVVVDEEETVVVSGHYEDINPGRKHQMEDVPLEANALEQQLVIAVPSVSTTGEALWDPLPVTLPTYVTKPRAGRTVRTIDFGQAGAWTSGHIEGEDVELPHRKDAGEDDQRRAVGH
jgi:hypothetical protein